MGEDNSGFGLLGHVAAPHQLGLPRGLPARARCGERRSRASLCNPEPQKVCPCEGKSLARINCRLADFSSYCPAQGLEAGSERRCQTEAGARWQFKVDLTLSHRRWRISAAHERPFGVEVGAPKAFVRRACRFWLPCERACHVCAPVCPDETAPADFAGLTPRLPLCPT